MSALMDAIMGAIYGVGSVLDTPGSIVRNSLAGENPFKGLFNPSERTYGRDLLEQWGVLDQNQPGMDWGDVAGFGVDVMADPLSILGFGKAAGGLGRAAANYADDAVKGATLGSGMGFMGEQLPFYSRARQAAEALPSRVKGQSLINQMQKVAPEGVSMGEIDALGIPQLTKQAALAPEDVIRHIDSQPPVAGLVYNNPTKYGEYVATGPDKLGGWDAVGGRGADSSMNYTEALIQASKPYGVPGGAYQDFPHDLRGLAPDDVLQDLMRDPVIKAKMTDAFDPFRSGHFKQPNIATHIRHTDRMTPGGEPVLFGDELQSDWFQGNPVFRDPTKAFNVEAAQQAAPLAREFSENLNAWDKATGQLDDLTTIQQIAQIDGRLADALKGQRYISPTEISRIQNMRRLLAPENELHQTNELLRSIANSTYKMREADMADVFGEEAAKRISDALRASVSEGVAPPPGWLPREIDDLRNLRTELNRARQPIEKQLDPLRDSILPSYHTNAVPDSPLKGEWQNLGLKYLLNKAAEEDYPWLALTRAETIQPVVGGGLKGQQAFYNKELIERMNKILGKQLRVDERVAPLAIQGLGEQSGIRITPELRKAILTKGLPLMGVGGAMSPLLRAVLDQEAA